MTADFFQSLFSSHFSQFVAILFASVAVSVKKVMISGGVTHTLQLNQKLFGNWRKILSSLLLVSQSSVAKMSDDLLVRAQNVVPPLTNTLYKGQAGRIGVIGGSFEYTGAPYFASMTAMRVGADAVHVFCMRDAAIPIKSYSPELMVHPVLDDEIDPIAQIEPWLDRLHVIVIGPGLGRNEKTIETVTRVIEVAKEHKKPIVIDADGLFLVARNASVLKDYPGVILTPNAVEFDRIFANDGDDMKAKFEIFGKNATVLKKGFNDTIYSSAGNSNDYEMVSGGGGRRCSGQGDILSGTVAVFYNWALAANDPDAAKVACYAASYFVKKLNMITFQQKGRSMIASDMIEKIHDAFERYFEGKQQKK